MGGRVVAGRSLTQPEELTVGSLPDVALRVLHNVEVHYWRGVPRLGDFFAQRRPKGRRIWLRRPQAVESEPFAQEDASDPLQDVVGLPQAVRLLLPLVDDL